MGLLSKRRDAVAPAAIGDGYSVLDAKLTIFGDISTEGTIRLDGRLEGSIRNAGIVILGPEADVRGNVIAREVIVGGCVSGNIEASSRVELLATAVVNGDIEADAVLIHEGGSVRGRMCVRSRIAEGSTPSMPARIGQPTPRSLARIEPPKAVKETA